MATYHYHRETKSSRAKEGDRDQNMENLINNAKCLTFILKLKESLVASPVAEHRLWTRRLSGHGSWAQPLRGMWDLPRPGHEPVSPASAGGLSTSAPPGKPYRRIS